MLQNLDNDTRKRGVSGRFDKLTPEPATKKRPVILVFSDYYLPGYKSGGGMRTLVNVVDHFGDEYDFRIVTRDHDGKADRTPYAGIEYGTWGEYGKAKVRHLSRDEIRMSTIRALVDEISPDVVFCNSYFSTLTVFFLVLRKLRKVDVPLVIAPQGEISEGALGLKSGKKKMFLSLSKSLGLYQNIVWRASSQIEADEIERAKGKGGTVIVAPDLSPKRTAFDEEHPRTNKEVGRVDLIFLSRIHPKKNLSYLLDVLSSVSGTVKLDVVGPMDSEEYLAECRRLIDQLPSNVEVEIIGEIEHSEVPETLARHHFFVLPTLSENFGHVFVEAMSAGLPLIISDRTPWLDLESKRIGWDISLDDRQKWMSTIDRCAEMTPEEFNVMSDKAREFAKDWVENAEIVDLNRQVFETALSRWDV